MVRTKSNASIFHGFKPNSNRILVNSIYVTGPCRSRVKPASLRSVIKLHRTLCDLTSNSNDSLNLNMICMLNWPVKIRDAVIVFSGIEPRETLFSWRFTKQRPRWLQMWFNGLLFHRFVCFSLSTTWLKKWSDVVWRGVTIFNCLITIYIRLHNYITIIDEDEFKVYYDIYLNHFWSFFVSLVKTETYFDRLKFTQIKTL